MSAAISVNYGPRAGHEFVLTSGVVAMCSDINYLNCASPPPGVVSTKQQRDRYRQKLLAAFEPHYHPDHCVPRYAPPYMRLESHA